jgi:hypothetical protein
LQSVWIWTRAIQGAAALPVSVRAVHRFAGDPLMGPLTVDSHILTPPQETACICDVRVYDAAGRLCYRLEHFQGQSSRQLNRLGGGWQGGEPESDFMEAAQ